MILFSKGANEHLGAWPTAAVPRSAWTGPLTLPSTRGVAGKVALQGNIDPAVLRAPPDVIRDEAARVIDSYGDGPGHVFNLGHGITPDIDPDHVAVLVDAVHDLGRGRAGG